MLIETLPFSALEFEILTGADVRYESLLRMLISTLLSSSTFASSATAVIDGASDSDDTDWSAAM